MLRVPSRLVVLGSLSTVGCATLIGLPDYGSGTGGSGASGGTSSTSSTTSTATTSGTAGSASSCQEGASCYDGLDGTEGVGSCKAGTISCDGGVPVCNGDIRPVCQVCSSSTDDTCDGIKGCTGAFRWAQSGVAVPTPTAMAAGMDGTVALVGMTGQMAGDVVVTTYDARGRSCWGPTTFGGGAMAIPFAAVLSGYKTADGRGSQMICRGGDGGTSTDIAATTIIAGQATGPVDFGKGSQMSHGGKDGFVAAVGPTGAISWGQLIGSLQDDVVWGLAAGPMGEIYVAGSTQGSMTLGGTCMTIGSGASPSNPIGFVAKLAPDGTCTWIQPFTGTAAAATSATLAGDGSVVVVGTFSGTLTSGSAMLMPGTTNPGNNTFVAKLSPMDGSVMGTMADLDVVNAGNPLVATGANGTFVVAGSFTGTYGTKCSGPTGLQTYLIRLNANFSPGAPQCYSSASANVGLTGLATDTAGGIVLGLNSAGPIQSTGFAGTIPAGILDVVKFDTTFPNYRWFASNGPPSYSLPGTVAVDGMGNVVVSGADIMPFNPGGGSIGPGTVLFELAP